MSVDRILAVVSIIIGVLVSYFFYRRGLQSKEPCWDVSDHNLIYNHKSLISDVKILYRDEQVDSLSVAKIVFWNRGRETIERRHIVPADRLRIVPGGDARLLEVAIVATSRPGNEVTVSPSEDGREATIDFSYLDQGDGVVIQVVHSGSWMERPALQGTIMGVKALRGRASRRWPFRYLFWMLFLMVFIMAPLWALLFITTSWDSLNMSRWIYVIVLGMAILSSVLGTSFHRQIVHLGGPAGRAERTARLRKVCIRSALARSWWPERRGESARH